MIEEKEEDEIICGTPTFSSSPAITTTTTTSSSPFPPSSHSSSPPHNHPRILFLTLIRLLHLNPITLLPHIPNPNRRSILQKLLAWICLVCRRWRPKIENGVERRLTPNPRFSWAVAGLIHEQSVLCDEDLQPLFTDSLTRPHPQR